MSRRTMFGAVDGAALTAEVSFNEGTTWKKVNVSGKGPDSWGRALGSLGRCWMPARFPARHPIDIAARVR
ncbi:hypothetical protein ACIBF5_31170 [Micromonospora sp. NPDC050417]|uniref:hypothetical protein n=1 Tax=Micromonospora sp. NPDC050417 TaxID=3364280 RepID=UPI0037B7385D